MSLLFRLILAVILLSMVSFRPSFAETTPSEETSPVIKRLSTLDRHYTLSFLWFDRLATGQLSFAPDPSSPKHFRAILEAKTLGVAAWLTGDRIQRYETLMELTPEGRFLPLKYSSMIFKKSDGMLTRQTKLYTFDSVTRTIMMTRIKEGKSGTEHPVKFLGEHFPVDFLTAGFNYISGADGPLRAGAVKEITTFTDDGESKITIEVLTAEQWPKTPFFTAGRGTLLKFLLPKEILDTGGGAVYALLDAESLPERVIVENVLGMGNVRGELRP